MDGVGSAWKTGDPLAVFRSTQSVAMTFAYWLATEVGTILAGDLYKIEFLFPFFVISCR